MPQEPILPFCACGCGNPVAFRSNRFIHGHQAAKRPVRQNASPFKIEGVYCRLIPLTHGFYAIVDEADYDWLMYWHWAAYRYKKTWYAVRRQWINGKKVTFYMHREIKKIHGGKLTDHRNGIGLDNRQNNLRPANHGQNAANRERTKMNGIRLRKGRYLVRLKVNKREQFLGSFSLLDEAVAARDEGVKRLFGEWTR